MQPTKTAREWRCSPKKNYKKKFKQVHVFFIFGNSKWCRRWRLWRWWLLLLLLRFDSHVLINFMGFFSVCSWVITFGFCCSPFIQTFFFNVIWNEKNAFFLHWDLYCTHSTGRIRGVLMFVNFEFFLFVEMFFFAVECLWNIESRKKKTMLGSFSHVQFHVLGVLWGYLPRILYL